MSMNKQDTHSNGPSTRKHTTSRKPFAENAKDGIDTAPVAAAVATRG